MHWLTKVPIAMLNAHLARLDPLQAEEAIRGTRVSAIGSGMLKGGGEVVDEWERVARGRKPNPKPAPLTPALAESWGIGVAIEPTKAAG